LTSHAYDEATAAQIIAAIRHRYFAEFQALQAKLEDLKRKEEK
jgi:hypothetical protein